MKKATKKDIEIIKQAFIENYSDAVTELNYTNDYELLIAIILSAQCTDKRVNIITPALFLKYPSVKELALAELEDVKALLNTCSFFNNKAKNIIKMAQSVLSDYDGEIPHDQKKLMKLAGVGNKTANVFMIEFEGANLMAVDTHVFRVSNRIGLSIGAKTPYAVEKQLIAGFQKEYIFKAHHWLILHGRYICTARSPKCSECGLQAACIFFQKQLK